MSELFVKNARHIKSHILEIEFSNGEKKVIDFAPFIFSARHPDYESYKTEAGFLNFKISDGNLNWDDYTMIFPVEDLYSGKLVS
jgi:Protein of unknown function (DUF2442)